MVFGLCSTSRTRQLGQNSEFRAGRSVASRLSKAIRLRSGWHRTHSLRTWGKQKMAKGETIYSEDIEGTQGNYNWSVRFDETNGFIGISQGHGEVVPGRVLLSPNQVSELVRFAARQHRRKPARSR